MSDSFHGIYRLQMQQAAGFTLLEVMVALAIFAVAAVAITKVSMNYTQSIGQMRDRTYAHFVAMNEFARMEVAGEWPEGTSETTISEQGSQWLVSHQVYTTPSPDVKRVEIRIAAADQGKNQAGNKTTRPTITSITGFLKRPVALSQNLSQQSTDK